MPRITAIMIKDLTNPWTLRRNITLMMIVIMEENNNSDQPRVKKVKYNDTDDDEDHDAAARPDKAEDSEEDDDAGVRRRKDRIAGQEDVDVSLLAQTSTELTWQIGEQENSNKTLRDRKKAAKFCVIC